MRKPPETHHRKLKEPAHPKSAFRWWISCVFLWGWLAGCGASHEVPTPKPKTIVHPSKDEIAHGIVAPGSYLVAFRPIPGGPTSGTSSYLQESLEHSWFLESRFAGDNRVTSTRFITSLAYKTSQAKVGFGREENDMMAPPFRRLRGEGLNVETEPAASLMEVNFKSPEDAKSVLSSWDEEGVVWFAEPNGLSQLSEAFPPDFKTLATQYEAQKDWWIERIRLPEAFRQLSLFDWAKVADDKGYRPIIAVMDSGIDYEHPALKERIWVNPQPGISGCDNDLHGCDTTQSSRGRLGKGSVWPFDLDGPGKSCWGKDPNCSHGTHVAGIIAADNSWLPAGTGRAPVGICPTCRIMILKVVSKVGQRSGILDSSILAALKYVSHFRNRRGPQVRVINASFGKFSKSRSIGIAIRTLKSQGGPLIIGAAGNADTMRMEYPAAFEDAIAVSAVDEQLEKLSFSNFGSWVDIAAPGASIPSIVPGQFTDSKSGTSMATPIVSGVAGLILARYPDTNIYQLREKLLDSSDPELYGQGETNRNERYYLAPSSKLATRQPLLGVGLVNAEAAIKGRSFSDRFSANKTSRVRPGCGTTALKNAHQRQSSQDHRYTKILLFLAGMAPACYFSRRNRSSGGTSKSL